MSADAVVLILLASLAAPVTEHSARDSWPHRYVLRPEECSAICLPPGKCIELTKGRVRCVPQCFADTECPYGYLCRCADYRKCALPVPSSERYSSEENTCSKVPSSRIHKTRMGYHGKLSVLDFTLRGEIVRRYLSKDSCRGEYDDEFGVCVVRCQEHGECPLGMSCYKGKCVIDCWEHECPRAYSCHGQRDIMPLGFDYGEWIDFPHCKPVEM